MPNPAAEASSAASATGAPSAPEEIAARPGAVVSTTLPANVPAATPRTIQEAVFEARYAFRFHEMCERLYERVDFVIGVLTLAGGSAAIAAAIKAWPTALIVCSAVFGTLGIVSRLWGAGRRAERHAFAKKAYAELDAESPGKTLAELDKALAKLEASSPAGFTGLAQPAYNKVVRRYGYGDYAEPLSRWESFLCLIV